MNNNAKWIWDGRAAYNQYNDAITAVRKFSAEYPGPSRIKIAADSWYRLFVNGHWVADGQSRSWPEHFGYDTLDITDFLVSGDNEIKVICRYFGCGLFWGVPRQAGLLAQITVHEKNGILQQIVTDHNWQVADICAWVRNTPKISIQMEPAELYDATREDRQVYRSAVELFPASDGPWKNLHDRNVSRLTKKERQFLEMKRAVLLDDPPLSFSIAHTRLMNPGLIEANGRVFSPFGIATLIVMHEAGDISIESGSIDRGFFKTTIDGTSVENKKAIRLSEGSHLLIGFARNILNSDKTISIIFRGDKNFTLKNPVDSGHDNPWSYLPFREYAFVQDDMVWRWFAARLSEGKDAAYEQVTDDLLSSIRTVEDFRDKLSGRAENMAFHELFVEDSYLDFRCRQELQDASSLIENPHAAFKKDDQCTVIHPSEYPVELMFDLGEENCGYIYFDMETEEDLMVDVFGVEYVHVDGTIQFTANNRNGFRYICRKGNNRYLSVKRRAGRYFFMIFRNVRNKVRLRNICMVESTYPAGMSDIFSCSDARMNKIFEISARALKLCMEDVYTDCPLYEQVLWVGDLRNEALYGYYAFGAIDIARNSLLLAAQSTERYGIVGAQVPSSWDMLIPAYSFIWIIAVWEYFWYTGDHEFLKQLFPFVLKNIREAGKYLTDHRLFSAECWNFFDWAKIDQEHRTVFHNSMIMVGGLNAAAKCAAQLKDFESELYFKETSKNLTESINRYWDSDKNAYPDSLHSDGSTSSVISQHTSFLSFLYDIADPENTEKVVNNILNPPPEMIRPGSPFATHFMLEAMEKAGSKEKIIQFVREMYEPMIDAGATTGWESYPQGTLAFDGFPTRSHCHGWAAAPVYFFQRIILGVRQTEPGCSSFEISPYPCGLTRAAGTVKTVKGDINVSWECNGEQFTISWDVPVGIKISFKENDSLASFLINLK